MNPHQVRQSRICRLRLKIQDGWNMDDLRRYVSETMGMEEKNRIEALIDEAALPFREKYRREQESQKTLYGENAIDKVI